MKKLFLLFLAIIALIFRGNLFAQQPEKTAKTIAEATKMLNGSWNWMETTFASRGVKPTTKTPATTKENVVVTFTHNNKAQVTVNKKVVGTYSYTLREQPNDYIIISFSDEQGNNLAAPYLEEGPLNLSANQLYIAGGYNDAGSNQTFKKVVATKSTSTTKAKKK